MFICLAALAVLSVAFHPDGTEALTCYSCNKTCPSPINTTNLDTITCAKNDQCISFSFISPTNGSVTAKGCAVFATCDALNTTWTSYNTTLTSCSRCKEDRCNSANNLAMPLLVMVTGLLMVKFVQ